MPDKRKEGEKVGKGGSQKTIITVREEIYKDRMYMSE